MAADATPDAGANFRYLEGQRKDVLLVCDHASRDIPAYLDQLGLGAHDLERHIAWDPGAGELTEALAAKLSAPALLNTWSRLVADANRDPDGPELAPAESDQTLIPGNLELDADSRAQRVQRFHRPYHQRIEHELDALREDGAQPLIASIHSFTPLMAGQIRPWHVALLWTPPDRLGPAVIHHLRRQGFAVGDNQPYSGRDSLGYTLQHHAVGRGLPYLLFEVRQDLLAERSGRAQWAEALAAAIEWACAWVQSHSDRPPQTPPIDHHGAAHAR